MKRMMLSNWLSPWSGPRISPSACCCSGGILSAKLLFQQLLGAFADAFLELGAQHFADGAVKFHRLRQAHVQHFDADDVKPRAGEEINHVAGTAGREFEIVRLDEHQRALADLSGG